MAKFVIKDLESGLYFNSIYSKFDKEDGAFDSINKATVYSDPKDVTNRLSKLPKGFYTVEKLIIKN